MPRNDVCTLQMRDTGVHVVCIVGNVGGSAKAVVAAAGRLGHGMVAQAATRRTARCEQEIRAGNVGGSVKAVVAAAGRLGHGVVAGRLAQVVNGRTRSRDEENVLIEGYARVGMCRVCILRRPRAHTCMYVCTTERNHQCTYRYT